ncbi:MAG: PEP-CTERM sorting domain-containing protein [Bryobacteraceae bacterium]|nr:PEP-CTERM sorting domain-containing protein [Bryobacteraceae bacterium]MCX7603922.1 PEP-CTERM sorting domain-containing protein [Bryobacteraceae bacterium]
MRKIFQRSLRAALLAAAVGHLAAAAVLLPESALGVGRTVQITNDRLLLVLNGGRYNGLVDGFDTDLWCVDVERFASKGNTYLANVIPLERWTPQQAALVRKGALGNEGFYWSDLGLDAVQRYQAAAWLITQMEAYRSGASVYSDLHYQQAIWAILDDAEFMSIYITDEAQAHMRAAAAFIRANPDYGLGQWAVISGSVWPDGTFVPWLYWQYQTFLSPLARVQPPLGSEQVLAPIADAPEPAALLLTGLGLALIGLLARRSRG